MINEIAKVFDLTEERFKQVAPQSISYEAERGFAMQLLTNNQKLMNVALGNQPSLAQAITNVAAIGLSLNPAEKQAYLLSRKYKYKDEDNREKWGERIHLEPSYIGFCRLATNSGSIDFIQAKTVHDNDEFIDNGVDEKPTHKYNAFKDRGQIVGFYCVAKTVKGDYLTTIMNLEDTHKIRARSESWKAGQYGPWADDFEEMAKKSVVRRAFKMWPRSVTGERMAQAVHISNENEGFEPIVTSPTIHDFSADQKNYFDQMIEKSDSLGMYVFASTFDLNDATSQGASVWTSLLHSFPKGEKGKYGKLVNELMASGESLFTDILNEFETHLGEDDFAIQELFAEIDNDTILLIENKLPPEMVMEFNRVKEAESNGKG